MNLTPRPGKDTDQRPKGLSTFDRPDRAAPPGKKVQITDTELLTLLTAVADDDPPGHVSLRPDTQEALDDWAASRGTSGPAHPLTEDVKQAIIGEERVGR